MVGVALTLVLAAFVVRLLQVQAVDASTYASKAAVNRWVTHEVVADRGTITDRSGVDLATTVDASDITADPYLFTFAQTKVKDAPQQAAQLLAPIVGGDATKIAQQLATPNSRYQVIARQQSPQVWNQIKDLKAAFADKAAAGEGADVMAGIFNEPHTRRVYPAGDLGAGVIGFVNA
jgi:cell division protein FtsI (penicillin-binding protein 3)